MLAGCVVSCSSTYQGCHLPNLVRTLGGSHTQTLDDSCTHVVTSSTRSHRYLLARYNYPHIPVVHPRWLWACYWSRDQPPPMSKFAVDFYLEAMRTGTCTALGTRRLFYRELPLFVAVEDHVLPHGIRGRCMANLLNSEFFDRESPHWPFVCRALQHTAFWGTRIRCANWQRRRVLLMCLQRGSLPPVPRRYMRACHDGPVPVLRRVARLPPELWRKVVAYC